MTSSIPVPRGYQAQDERSLPEVLRQYPDVTGRIGGTPDTWRVEEIGDGNLNLVFKVRGPESGVVVKQALPYVRLVGESWPLPLSRAHYERMALAEQSRQAPGLVPEVFHYDEELSLIVMELLEPHIIMRHGMIAGTVYPKFVEDLTTFAAQTLFHTSDLARPAAEKRQMIATFSGNAALCKISEDLIFTEPYTIAKNNRWTRPYLNQFATTAREDGNLKIAVCRLKLKFMSSAEALLHGDLHTGSIMLTATDTRVIDPEFAFVGPMGFDLGAVIANLLLNYFSQDGHEIELEPGARDAYREWILETIEGFWTGFREKFLGLWCQSGIGDAYPAYLFQEPAHQACLENERTAYMESLFADTLGFAGAKMNRRILGLAHNIDLESIEDPAQRAVCEARALTLAYDLIVKTGSSGGFTTVREVTEAARKLHRWSPVFD